MESFVINMASDKLKNSIENYESLLCRDIKIRVFFCKDIPLVDLKFPQFFLKLNSFHTLQVKGYKAT